LHANVGLDLSGADAPLSLWSGAGTGQGRSVLLRAHPLLVDGVIRDGIFGRTLVHGGVEWRHALPPVRHVVRIAPAIFLDSARAFDGLAGFDRRTHADVGAGLRIPIPGSGVIRLDVAHGLVDGRTAFSVGWTK